MRIRNEKVIDVSEWDSLVRKTYGRPYSFQQQDECKDRGVFRFTVPAKADDHEQESVPEIVNHEKWASALHHGSSETRNLRYRAAAKMLPASIYGGVETSTQTYKWWQMTYTPKVCLKLVNTQ